MNFFYNSVQWLLGEEDKITILPKQAELTQVSIPAREGVFIRGSAWAYCPWPSSVSAGSSG